MSDWERSLLSMTLVLCGHTVADACSSESVTTPHGASRGKPDIWTCVYVQDNLNYRMLFNSYIFQNNYNYCTLAMHSFDLTKDLIRG